MFGNDPKALEWAKRFTDPAAAGKTLLAAQQRIRSGEYKRSAPKSDSPEDMKAWREEQGIPEAPTEYPFPLPGGAEFDKLDDAAKGRIGFFRDGFHKMNMPASMAEGVVKLYNEAVEKDAMAQAKADADLQDQAEDTLIADWGKNYRTNLAANMAFLTKGLGEDMAVSLLDARLPDGRRFMNIPEVAKWINTMARAESGDFLDPGTEGGAGASNRLEEIRTIMRTDFSRYQRENLAPEYERLVAQAERRGTLKPIDA